MKCHSVMGLYHSQKRRIEVCAQDCQISEQCRCRIIKKSSDFEECSECRINPAIHCLLNILYSMLLKRKLSALIYVSLFCLYICTKFMAVAPLSIIQFKKAKGKFTNNNFSLLCQSGRHLGNCSRVYENSPSKSFSDDAMGRGLPGGTPVTDSSRGATRLALRLQLRSAGLSTHD